MNQNPYRHAMAAHCESGVISGLLRHEGLDLSEPLVFGMSGAFFFGYFDNARFAAPMLAFRTAPGDIRKQIAKNLGVKFATRTFSNPAAGQAALDALLAQGRTVGVQVDMFNMEYIPQHMRVHNNAHFVIVCGASGDGYEVSDCYYPDLATVSKRSVTTARFARGSFAPKGIVLYPESLPAAPDLAKAVRAGILHSCKYMLKLPVPFLGYRGIQYFARKIKDWPAKIKDEQFLSHCFMRINIGLEEMGTGGAGFRFLYATFLQDAAKATANPELARLSKAMMENGDRWREISLAAARIGKRKDFSAASIGELSERIAERADVEKGLMLELAKAVD